VGIKLTGCIGLVALLSIGFCDPVRAGQSGPPMGAFGGLSAGAQALSPAAAVSAPLSVTASPLPPGSSSPPPFPPAIAYPVYGVGVGFPDVRFRATLNSLVDLEAKVALAPYGQAYSARLYLETFYVGPVSLDLGAESGYLKYTQIEGFDGDGYFVEPFGGLDFHINPRWRLIVDLGPAWIDLSSEGQNLAAWQWTYNTALYYYLF
jgi:hypothetical protein